MSDLTQPVSGNGRTTRFVPSAGTICAVKVLLSILRKENPMAVKKLAAKKKAAKKSKGVGRENAKGRQ
jgi:hypothetical protein